ncbi:putative E3 ubiquitin-protein ligase KCMF1 [Plasmopara halstedii]
MNVSANAASPIMIDVESQRANVETTSSTMNLSAVLESAVIEVKTEQSPVLEQLEPQKPIEDGAESDKARTDSDDDDDDSLLKQIPKQEISSPAEGVKVPVEAPNTLIEKSLTETYQEPMTSVENSKAFLNESSRTVEVIQEPVKPVDPLITTDEEHIACIETQQSAKTPVEASTPLDDDLSSFEDAHQDPIIYGDATVAVQTHLESTTPVESFKTTDSKLTISTQESVTLVKGTDISHEEYSASAEVQQEPSTPVETFVEPKTPVDHPRENSFEDDIVVETELLVQEDAAGLQSVPSPYTSVEENVEAELQPHEIELTVQEEKVQGHEIELVIPSPQPMNLVHHDIDDEASDSDESDIYRGDEDDDVNADLGTPLGYGGTADFGESQDEFTSHRFLGPSVVSDPSSVRALHTLRRVALHDKPPRFVSSAPAVTASSGSVTSSGESSGRNSSNSSATYAPKGKSELRSQSEADFVERPLNTYTLTFTEQVLGFHTNVVVSLENELLVEVCSVEKDSPAQRGGVVVGDCLVSVNGLHIEPHMTKDQVLEIIQSSTLPRTLVFQRDLHDKDGGHSKSLPDKKGSPVKPLIGRLGAAMSQGASIIGSRWKRKKTIVHPNSFCDGCGMDPVIGALWTCSVCSNYNLCSECYDLGTHGMENTEQMQALNEAIVQYKLQKLCKDFTPEFFLSLRRDICKGRPDKFEYLGEWIANIVVGTSAAKITVRGIEIPSLPPAARQRFVSHLMPLVSNRTDIEVNIEWLPDDADYTSAADRASVDRMSIGAYGSDEEEDDIVIENLEKLRIWISDKKTRTTSPFA